MRKVIVIILSVIFTLTCFTPITYASYSQMPEFLCELGLKFYRQGRYEDALLEFKKALLIKPNYEPALKYVQMLEQMKLPERKKEEFLPAAFKPAAATPAQAVKETLDLIEIQREMIMEKQLLLPQLISPLPKGAGLIGEGIVSAEEPTPVKVITLDESFYRISFPIEIEQGKGIVLLGRNISRFLVTSPEIIDVKRVSPDELLVTGKDIGYTYLHVWDQNGRWTLEFLGVFPKPEGPTYEELMRQEEEKARNFKLRYSLDWSSYETGRRIHSLDRSGSYTWTHTIGITGQTPYGDLDTAATVRKLKTTTDLTYATLGLTNGQFGPFKGFSLRAGDYNPYFSNLAFPGVGLRGVMFSSPVFNKKLDYDIFWGREGGGRFPDLFPELYKIKHSFLSGANFSFSPLERHNYRFSVVHGWGRHRDDYLNRYGYDLSGTWNFDNWGWGYEAAFDSETFAHLVSTNYRAPNIQLTTELRNIDKDFLSITGSGWRQGELGGLFNLMFKLGEDISVSNRLDVYLDRLYPALDNDGRWNEDFDWGLNYRIDPETNLDLSYSIQNELGKLSQSRYQSSGINLSRTFKLIRQIHAHAGYSYQENTSFSSHSIDYTNDKIDFGLRFSIIGELYYYLNKEFNWLAERYYGDHSRPHALETGLDWSSQFGRTPFYGDFRFTFRDEENTTSNLSFLSGEDYIEGYTEFGYRKEDGKEIYGSCRVRNSWADNPNVTKRVEASFNAGMRYIWDTGLRWDSVCNIEGYVFRDLNSDGLRQRDEPPVEGVKLWLGKDKSQITDLFGYFNFKGVRGRKAYVNIDMSTLPSGFLLTVPAHQEVVISHNQTIRLHFGIMTRSEISGVIFEDRNGNGKFDSNEIGIEGVEVLLEDGAKATTDTSGRYSFPNASTGERTISLDLDSVPVYYLPKAAVTKKITLFEGVTYIYNIPLKKIADKSSF